MRLHLLAMAVLAAALGVSAAHAAEGPFPPLTLDDTEVRDMTASGSGESFRIFIRKPDVPPPPQGYPVIYALGANANFLTFVDLMRQRSENPIRRGVAPAIIVGIGLKEDRFDIDRWVHDFTPPAKSYDLPQRPNKQPWPEMGGADRTLDFIEKDLKPAIAGDFQVDTSRETLMGHSFAGLFTLYALFTRPDLFDTYLAASPSIWFNRRQIFQDMQRFTDHPPADIGDKRLYIGIGSLEQAPAKDDQGLDHPELHAKWKDNNRMIDNARELVEALHEELPALHAELQIFEGENHGTILPVFISRTLSIAAPPQGSGSQP